MSILGIFFAVYVLAPRRRPLLRPLLRLLRPPPLRRLFFVVVRFVVVEIWRENCAFRAKNTPQTFRDPPKFLQEAAAFAPN